MQAQHCNIVGEQNDVILYAQAHVALATRMLQRGCCLAMCTRRNSTPISNPMHLVECMAAVALRCVDVS
jgi:hypothetical protein